MGKTFDFNAIQKTSMEIKMSDPAQTVLHVTTPPERLIEQLTIAADNMVAAEASNSADKIQMAYILGAEIISCNLEGVKVTADDLRNTYKIEPIALAAFTAAYMDFINEIKSAKN